MARNKRSLSNIGFYDLEPTTPTTPDAESNNQSENISKTNNSETEKNLEIVNSKNDTENNTNEMIIKTEQETRSETINSSFPEEPTQNNYSMNNLKETEQTSSSERMSQMNESNKLNSLNEYRIESQQLEEVLPDKDSKTNDSTSFTYQVNTSSNILNKTEQFSTNEGFTTEEAQDIQRRSYDASDSLNSKTEHFREGNIIPPTEVNELRGVNSLVNNQTEQKNDDFKKVEPSSIENTKETQQLNDSNTLQHSAVPDSNLMNETNQISETDINNQLLKVLNDLLLSNNKTVQSSDLEIIKIINDQSNGSMNQFTENEPVQASVSAKQLNDNELSNDSDNMFMVNETIHLTESKIDKSNTDSTNVSNERFIQNEPVHSFDSGNHMNKNEQPKGSNNMFMQTEIGSEIEKSNTDISNGSNRRFIQSESVQYGSEDNFLSHYHEQIEKRKPLVEETHTRDTYLIRNDLLERFNRLAKNEKKGFKMRFINYVLEKELDKIEKINRR